MAETFTPCSDLRTTLRPLAKFGSFLLSAVEIRVNVSLVFQVKGDGSVNAAELQGRETILNLFCSCPLIELIDDSVEWNARVQKPDGTVFVHK